MSTWAASKDHTALVNLSLLVGIVFRLELRVKVVHHATHVNRVCLAIPLGFRVGGAPDPLTRRAFLTAARAAQTSCANLRLTAKRRQSTL